jgi:glucokinase
MIDWPEGRIRYAPNNTYHDLPLRRLLEEALHLPAIVDNDANVAAWGEARWGQGSDYMLFLTVGTGVGGGLILGGELYRGATGVGGEVGHLVVDAFGPHQCGCGNVGCLEAVASGTALGRYGQAAAQAEPDSTIARLAGDPARVTGQMVHQAAQDGDPLAIGIYTQIGTWLGIGAASLVNVLDVDRITVGGGVAASGELLLSPFKAGLMRHLFAPGHRRPPAVGLATLGWEAGWMGAALLALKHGEL